MKLEREKKYKLLVPTQLLNENLWKFLAESYGHINSNTFTITYQCFLDHNWHNHIAPMFFRRQAYFLIFTIRIVLAYRKCCDKKKEYKDVIKLEKILCRKELINLSKI